MAFWDVLRRCLGRILMQIPILAGFEGLDPSNMITFSFFLCSRLLTGCMPFYHIRFDNALSLKSFYHLLYVPIMLEFTILAIYVSSFPHSDMSAARNNNNLSMK